jgi:hypothetical protein
MAGWFYDYVLSVPIIANTLVVFGDLVALDGQHPLFPRKAMGCSSSYAVVFPWSSRMVFLDLPGPPHPWVCSGSSESITPIVVVQIFGTPLAA